ncbi:speckle-type POZ protein [Caerostris darwini]|uniref:Speckle-type POZ protein n=1 Tax=Caerostris darwini TaxID=1538125 RepID=A0AAV4QVW5_9ARAC|nr:speckle-type POZ protein [Caerostris darwini]
MGRITSSERKGFSITWIIGNFDNSTVTNGDCLESPTFIVDTMEETKWCLFLYPVCDDDAVEDDILIGLRRMPDCKGPPSIKIDIEYALLTADCSVAGEYTVTKQKVSENESVVQKLSDLMCVISADEFEKIFSNRNLQMRIKMWKCSGEINNDGYCMARKHIGVEKKSSIWPIWNFSTLEKGNELTNNINSTLNDKLIVTLKFSVTGEDETLQVRFISSDSEVESRCCFSIKLSVLDSNGDAVTCGESEVFFCTDVKESECLLTLTKKEIMRKKSQYLRDDVLRLLYECDFSTGLVYGEIENTNYGWIPHQTANVCLPDLNLAENTATTNPSAPSVLKRDIELMLHENVLCVVKLRTKAETFPAHCFRDHVVEIQRLNEIYRSNDLDSSFEYWMCSVVGKFFYSTPKMTLIID